MHLSLVLGKRGAPIRFRQPWNEMDFDGVHGFKQASSAWSECVNMKKFGFAKLYGQAAYYSQMPKFLEVDSAGSKTLCKDYPIQQTTIASYLQVSSSKWGRSRMEAFVPLKRNERRPIFF